VVFVAGYVLAAGITDDNFLSSALADSASVQNRWLHAGCCI